MGNKKPIYKQVWFWIVAVILVVGLIGVIIDEIEESKEVETEEVINKTDAPEEENTNDNAVDENNDNEESTNDPEDEPENEPEKDKPLDLKIEINNTIELNGATIVLQSLRVQEDSTKLYGYWNHNSQYDKAHIGLLVTVVFKQNDEELKILNSDRLLKQREKMIDGSFDLEIERVDNSPIEITFIANTDERESESITLDIP